MCYLTCNENRCRLTCSYLEAFWLAPGSLKQLSPRSKARLLRATWRRGIEFCPPTPGARVCFAVPYCWPARGRLVRVFCQGSSSKRPIVGGTRLARTLGAPNFWLALAQHPTGRQGTASSLPARCRASAHVLDWQQARAACWRRHPIWASNRPFSINRLDPN